MCNTGRLTSNTSEELSRKALYLAVREGYKAIALEKIKDTLTQKVHDNTYMTSVVETISEMDASVSVLLVVGFECCEHAQFNPRGIAILLY